VPTRRPPGRARPHPAGRGGARGRRGSDRGPPPWANPGRRARPPTIPVRPTRAPRTRAARPPGPARGRALRTRRTRRQRRPRPPRLRLPARAAGAGTRVSGRRGRSARARPPALAHRAERPGSTRARTPAWRARRPSRTPPPRRALPPRMAPSQRFQREPRLTSHDRRVLGMRRERASSARAAREIVVASWELSKDGARS
jgi:hypothetical protein